MTSLPTDRGNCMFHKLPFPWKLQQLLEDAEKDGNQDIISWLPCGRAFKIHNPKLFTAQIMALYFRQTQFLSFTRQLYAYGFKRILIGEHRGSFSHPDFVRGNTMSIISIIRDAKEKCHGKSSRQTYAKDISFSTGRKIALNSPIQVFNESRKNNSRRFHDDVLHQKQKLSLIPPKIYTTWENSKKKPPGPDPNEDSSVSGSSSRLVEGEIDGRLPNFSGDAGTKSDWLNVLLSKMMDIVHVDDDLEPRPIEVMVKEDQLLLVRQILTDDGQSREDLHKNE